MTKRICPKEFANEILTYDKIMILIHGHPDGDTAGTGIALLNILLTLGKETILVCADALPQYLEFVYEYANSKEKCFFGTFSSNEFTPEHIVSVDIASAGLVGDSLAEYAAGIELALDHHERNSLECPLLLDNESASSAGEVLFDVLCELEELCGKKLTDKNTACSAYTAIASDSGNFKYSSTSGKTLKIAGELVDRGADNAYIARRLFDIKSFGTFKAEAMCTENASFHCGGKIAFSYMTHELCKQRGILENEFDTCVQILRMIEGVEIAIFAKERTEPDSEEKYRLSMRSNEYADVSEICALFGGGGHAKAAACLIQGNLEDVIKKAITACEKSLKTNS